MCLKNATYLTNRARETEWDPVSEDRDWQSDFWAFLLEDSTFV